MNDRDKMIFKLRDMWMLAAVVLLLTASTGLDVPDAAGQKAHGGNISNLEISLSLNTIHWQGYVGNITLETTSPDYIYGYFNESGPGIGTIRRIELGTPFPPDGYLLIINSPLAPELSTLKAGNISIIDDITGTGADSGTNTFRNLSRYSIPGATLNVVPTVHTFVNGKEQYTDFKEGFLEDAEGNMVFVVPLAMPVYGYDGNTYNFQFIVPNNNPDPVTYYMYYVPAGFGSAAGVVKDKNGKIICGAVVYAGSVRDITDGMGRYELFLPPADHSITANASDRKSRSAAVTVAEAATTIRDFELECVEVKLAEGATDVKSVPNSTRAVFDLCVTNYGEHAAFVITNSSTSASVNISSDNFTLNENDTAYIGIGIYSDDRDLYETTITVQTDDSRANSIDLTAVFRNATGITLLSTGDVNSSLLHDSAAVLGNASVTGSAEVSGNAVVVGNAVVCGSAKVSGDAVVCDNAVVSDAAVSGSAKLMGDTRVSGAGVVVKDATLNNVRAAGSTMISGNFALRDVELVDATVVESGGEAVITGGKITIGGVTFTNIYQDTPVNKLVIANTSNITIPANEIIEIPSDKTEMVHVLISARSTLVGDLRLSKCCLNPDGTGFAMWDEYSGDRIGDYYHIDTTINNNAVLNVTIRFYYGLTEPTGDIAVAYYNENTKKWELLDTEYQLIGGKWYLSITTDHFSTFTIVTAKPSTVTYEPLEDRRPHWREEIAPTEVVVPTPEVVVPTPEPVGIIAPTEPVVPPQPRIRLIIFLIIFVLVLVIAAFYIWKTRQHSRRR